MFDHRYITFLALAHNLSFTKTAHEMFITQPAVSQQIQSLESDLGVPLIDHQWRKITLTAAGTELAQYIERIQIQNDHLLEDLQLTAKKRRPLKIGSTLSISSFMLPEVLAYLSKKNHKITTVVSNTDSILNELRSGEIDFAIVEGNFDKSEFDAVLIRSEDFIAVAHPSLATTDWGTNLFKQTLLVREPGSGTRDILENWLATFNNHLDEFDTVIEVGNPTSIINTLQIVPAVSFMYASLVREQLAQQTLIQFTLPNFSVSHPINLLFRKDDYFADQYATISTFLTNQL